MLNTYTVNSLRELVYTAEGRRKASLVITNTKLVNVLTHEIEEGVDIAVQGDRIVSVGKADKLVGKETITIDGSGLYTGPGLIDPHMHIESSLLTPDNFAKLALPAGTTAIFADPHEIENACGLDGLNYFVNTAKVLPLKIFITEASCVPPMPGFETGGAALTAEDVDSTIDLPEIIGLGEVMNYQDVLNGDRRLLGEIVQTLKRGKAVEGHAPTLRNDDLNAYLDAGITSDHQCTTMGEALEKLRRGMMVYARESSISQNVKEVIKAVTQTGIDSRNMSLCTDDITASDMYNVGHMNHVLARAIEEGVDPITAFQMATVNTALHYKMADTLGSIAPFKMADMILLNDITVPKPRYVIANGKVVAKDGILMVKLPSTKVPHKLLNSIKLKGVSKDAFSLPAGDGKSERGARVIAIKESTSHTKLLERKVNIVNGQVELDGELAKVAVFERYGRSGDVALGLVSGFNITKRGAAASSFSHDTHNIIVVGSSDDDMALAVNRIIEIQGGMVVVRDGRVVAQLELPIGGVLSAEEASKVIGKEEGMADAWKSLGCDLKSPGNHLSSLTLTAIPEIRITNRGLIDTVNFKPVQLFTS
ncbi:MAG: adenine deaminase [Nitrososphaerota archaeon]|jgi:adenine deaminase|nr:adenine deaminase [Nitrososphaerota archaeon]